VADLSGTRNGAASYEAGVAAGGPIILDTLGFRASVWHRTDGGYVDHVNPFTGAVTDPNSNYTQSSAARLALTFAPAEWFKVTPSIYWQRVMNHDTGAYYEYLSSQDHLLNGRLLRQPSDDSYYLASLKADANVGFADFVSVTSYFDRHGSSVNDLTSLEGAIHTYRPPAGYGNPLGAAFPTMYADAASQPAAIAQRVLAEEARLASADANARLTWVAGIYYSRAFQQDPNYLFAPYAPKGIYPYGLFQNNINIDTQTAAFGQLDFAVVGRLKATLGVRAAQLKIQNTQVNVGVLAFGAPPLVQVEGTQTPVTPKFGLSYQADEHNLYYASVAKGYRLGGSNTPVLPSNCHDNPVPPTYSPDSVWSYEIGAKNRLFDDRLQLATSAFHVKWINTQQNVLFADCGFQYITNAGEAVSNGFELAMQALLTRQLRMDVSLSYIDAHFTQDVVSATVPVTTTVAKGTAVGILPQVGSPWNATVSAEYHFDLAGHDAYVRLQDVFHSRNPGPFTSQIPNSLSYEPDLVPNPSTNLLNLRTSVSWNRYDLALYVDNVLNSQPRLGRYVDISGSTLFTDSTFRPTTVGIRVNMHFAAP
jgi:iron complex outermembrane receptor protein